MMPAASPADERLTRPPWNAQVCRCLEKAEKAVARYYAIRPREWSTRFRYDLASAADHPDLHFPASALAQIVRIEPAPADQQRYRIVLRDEEILRRARDFGLDAVLELTLAHELVHLVRFGQGLADFDQEGPEQQAEERRVQRIAAEALAALEPDEAERIRRMARQLEASGGARP
ncbi:MAG: hypothetical protein Q9Q40_01595 [Acidobacteriota bacterium]|nr:hypothetical protein [Acidobacteriota bacterium]MDQ7086400.1 hypothetical protein [Acidobacteriota bacterium]